MSGKTVAIIFGGTSVEHEISLVSSISIVKNIDATKFEIRPIYIAKSGEWYSVGVESLLNGEKGELNLGNRVVTEPSLNPPGRFYEFEGEVVVSEFQVDVVFPVLHGTYGEDGSIQGCFELMGVPYVGADTLGSSIGMDKIIMKSVLSQNGIPVVGFLGFSRVEWNNRREELKKAIGEEIGYPCFIKSANLGSSIGISKVHGEGEVDDAVKLSLKYSNRVIVEQFVGNAREIEVSVLGNDNLIASLPGEIISKKEFYDYEAKYRDGSAELRIPAETGCELVEELKSLAIRTFRVLCCEGMGRIDFLVNSETWEIFVSEINTIPGFTDISMYPKLWEASGVPYKDLITRLIELAEDSFRNKKRIQTDFL